MLGTWHGAWLMVGDELSIYQFAIVFWSRNNLSSLPFQQTNVKNGQQKFVREDYSGQKVANNTKLSNL